MFAVMYQPPALLAWFQNPLVHLAIGFAFGMLLMADWKPVPRWVKRVAMTVGALAIIWWPCWLYPFCDGGGGGW